MQLWWWRWQQLDLLWRRSFHTSWGGSCGGGSWSYEKCCPPTSIFLNPKNFQTAASAACDQSQNNLSGGDREKRKWKQKVHQWPLQTPGLINVKGFLFLICQSFQRSLTYAYSQPCSSPSQQVTEAAPQKPITAHLCWGCCCQSCKLAHLQPFIMQRSKEHNVVSFFFEVIQAVSSGVRHSGDRITCALNSHVYFALEFFQYFVWW